MKIVFATGNRHKIAELSKLFASYGVDELVSMRDAGFKGEIIEDADTFEGNALIKARQVCKFTGEIAIADDSGLCVDALDGKPGIYSARFAGENATDGENNEKLLKLLEGIPFEKRTARFVSVIAAVCPDGREVVAKGVCEGIITTEKRGSGDFGYDPLFYYEPLGMTFAEMSEETKNGISHRGRAVSEFCKNFF